MREDHEPLSGAGRAPCGPAHLGRTHGEPAADGAPIPGSQRVRAGDAARRERPQGLQCATLGGMSSFRAAVLDFDGLILETEGPCFESWRAVFREHGADTHFDTVTDENRGEIVLKHANSSYPPKRFVFPPIERLLTVTREDGELQIDASPREPKRAIFGIRSCDLAGIYHLDRFFLGREYRQMVGLDDRPPGHQTVAELRREPDHHCHARCGQYQRPDDRYVTELRTRVGPQHTGLRVIAQRKIHHIGQHQRPVDFPLVAVGNVLRGREHARCNTLLSSPRIERHSRKRAKQTGRQQGV